MIAPDRGKINIEDIQYRDGYRDAEIDIIKRATQKLWEKEAQLSKAFPQIALGIREAIEEIEQLQDY
jgi:acyl-[acyl carrier protein]--UDP-N-acetylglucosamine O-acyltransferase